MPPADRFALLETDADLADQVEAAERLGDVVVRADRQALLDVRRASTSAVRKITGRVARARVRADMLQHLVAVDVGHHDVEDDGVERLALPMMANASRPSGALHRVHALDAQPCLDQLRDQRVIFDDQDARLH